MRKFLIFLLPFLLLTTTLSTAYGITLTDLTARLVARQTAEVAKTGVQNAWLTAEIASAQAPGTTLNSYLATSANSAGLAVTGGTGVLTPAITVLTEEAAAAADEKAQVAGTGTCDAAGTIANNERGPADLCISGGAWNQEGALPTDFKHYESNSLTDLIDNLKITELKARFTSFNETQPNAQANLYLQGEHIRAVYTASAETAAGKVTRTLTITHTDADGQEVDSLKTSDEVDYTPNDQQSLLKAEEKAGKSIDDQLSEKFKSSEGIAFMRNLDRGAIQDGPKSPLAGNPASFMAEYVRNDYNSVHTVSYPGVVVPGSGVFSVIPTSGTFLMAGTATSNYGLGINYVKNLSADNAIIFNMPMGYSKIANVSDSYNLGIGFGFQHRFNSMWSLTPAIHAGVGGSADLGSGTILYDGSVTSLVNIPFAGAFNFGLTNDVSYLQTQALSIGGYTADVNINNMVTENGVDVSYKFLRPMEIGVFAKNTDVLSGQKWFMPSYSTVGFNINNYTSSGEGKNASVFNSVTSSMGYMFGKDFSGVSANITINF